MKEIRTILFLTFLFATVFNDCLAQGTGNGDTLYVNTKTNDEATKYLLDDVNKMTFSSKGVQLWSTSWPTEYPYGNVENLSFNSKNHTFAMGDVNIDGDVNVSDVSIVVGAILGNTLPSYHEEYADMNGDGTINVTDVILIVDLILNPNKANTSTIAPRSHLSMLARAQQEPPRLYLNFYQDAVVIKQIPTTEIDSIDVTETEPRYINLWRNGNIFLSYHYEDIDSITMTNNGGHPFSYAGIVGFNDNLYMKNIGILSSSTASQYRSFVNNLVLKDGTLLYYAVDNGLDMLDNANIVTPLKNVSLITFTDGLDQGSLMMTEEYGSSYEYLDAMSNRILSTTVGGLPVNAFSVGLRGNDVTNVSLFKQNIERLASSPDNAFEVSSINELREKLKAIADQIISVSNRQTISLKIPGIDNGTLMRFTFDGNTAEDSQLYIEGTFNLKDRSLHDVSYHGIKATSGTTVQGTQDGIFVTYTFTGLRLEAGSGLVPVSSIQHYYRLPSASSWQKNSEFNAANNTQTNVSHSGAVIFLHLDCSSSLGSDFSKMKQYANEFVDLIANNAEPYYLTAPYNVKAIMDYDEWAVKVSWDEVKYAQSYNVYRSSSSSGTYQLVAENITSTEWADENPLSGNNYYKVSAVCYGSTSYQSSYASVYVKLDAPTNVTAVMDDDEWAVNVSWDAVEFAESYSVYRSSSSSSGFTKVADNITATIWRDETPLQGANYYRICANGHGLTSPTSNTSKVVNCEIVAPANVQAVMDENEWAVNVTWEAVTYAEYYSVYRSSSASSGFSKVADSLTVTSWRDGNPLNGNNYYRIYANGHGLTSVASITSTVVTCVLSSPTNVKATMADEEWAVKVSWDAVKYAQSYKVYRSSSSSGTYQLVTENITSNGWTDENPLSGYNYYKVSAVCNGSTSSQSAYASVNVKLNAPTNVTAVMDDDEWAVNVSWNAVTHAEYYSVYRSSSASSGFTKVADSLTVTSWRDGNPINGNNYYRIYANGHGLTSTASNSSSLVTCVLSVPTNVNAIMDYEEWAAKVSWDAVKYAQGYKVYRSSSSSGTYQLVAENLTSTEWTDESPLNGYNYYKVAALGYGSTSSQSSYAYVNVKLDAPTNVTAIMDDDEWVVNVSWDAVAYAEYYSVYRSSSASSGFTKVADNLTVTTWRDEAPLPGNNYYRIYATGHGMTSEASNTSEVLKEMSAPTNVIASMDDEMNVNVSWDAVTYAEYYSIYRSNNSTSGFTKVAENVIATSWRDGAPLLGPNFYSIYAFGHGMASGASNTSEVVNYEIAPPTNVTATMDDNEMVVNVSWDAVKYAETYTVYRSNNSTSGFNKVADNLSSTTWRDESPLQGANYYRICANGHGLTSQTSSSSELVNCEIASPANVQAVMDDNEWVVNISWEAVKYAESYSVYRSNYSSSGFTKVADDLTVTNWRDGAPLSGNNYYRIYATGHGVTSTPGTAFINVTSEIAAPTNVTAYMDDDMHIIVRWDAVQYAETYTVYRRNKSSYGFTKVADGITVTTWYDESPLQGPNYYRIYANGHGKTSAASNTSNVVNYEIAAPTNVTAVKDNDEWAVNVCWDAVQYAESYSVYRSNNSSSGFSKVADNLTVTNWHDDAPLAGDNYYQIIATGHGMTSQPSNTSGVVSFVIAAPANVTASMDDNMNIIVRWDIVQYAESYTVYRSNNSSSGFTKVADNITVTTWIDESPLQGPNYYRIYANGHGGNSRASNSSEVVNYEIAPPTNVTAVMDDDEWAVNVSWDAVEFAESYSVYRSKNSSSAFTKVAENLTATNWRDEAPLQGPNYYRIYAMGHGITSVVSSTSNVVTCELSSPMNVIATMVDEDWAVKVSWDAVKYAQSYKVYRSSSSSGTYQLVAENITSTEWLDKNPLSGYNYYKVSAVCNVSTSSQSSYASVNVKLDTPTNVTAVMDDDEWAVDVSWNAVAHAEYYSVYRSSSSNSGFTKVADNLTVTSWRDGNPLNGNNYYRIYAYGHGLTSTASNSSSLVTCVLSVPTNVNAIMNYDEWAVKVSWSAVKYAQGYNVYRSSSPGGTYQLIAENITSTEWADENPLSGYNYYKVSAVCNGCTSSQSSYVSVNVKLDAPTNVTAVIDDEGWVVYVSWDAVAHAESYSVYRSKNSSSGFTKVADNLTVTSWRDEFPINGSNYYRVYAIGHGLTSSASQTSNLVMAKGALCPDNNHPHMIDLGLPSGTLWSCCNVDTEHPESQNPTNYGGYYAWGETETKSKYSESAYQYYKNGSYQSIGSDIAGTEYDVAHVKWGGSWVMPSYRQQIELCDNCTYEWTTKNGVKGGKFTSKTNGASIFLPAAGMLNGTFLDYANKGGYYWSSTQKGTSDYARHLYFDSGSADMNSFQFLFEGESVRPVVRY